MEIAANLRHMLACGLRNRRCAFGRHGLLPVRRKFVTLLGGAATWPLAVAAQQPTVPMIGFLRSSSLAGAEHLVAAFRQGLNITGFVEGQNASGISFRPGSPRSRTTLQHLLQRRQPDPYRSFSRGARNHQVGAQPVRTCESLLRGLSCRRQSSLELAASRGLNSTVLRETQRGGTEDRTCPCP